MKILAAHFHYEHRFNFRQSCSASLTVEGLGDIEIEDCFSQETFDRIAAEAETALKLKLGQKCQAIQNYTKDNNNETE